MTEPSSPVAVSTWVPRHRTAGHFLRWLLTPAWLWEYLMADGHHGAWCDMRPDEDVSVVGHVYLCLLTWVLLPVAAPWAFGAWVFRTLEERGKTRADAEAFAREQEELARQLNREQLARLLEDGFAVLMAVEAVLMNSKR